MVISHLNILGMNSDEDNHSSAISRPLRPIHHQENYHRNFLLSKKTRKILPKIKKYDVPINKNHSPINMIIEEGPAKTELELQSLSSQPTCTSLCADPDSSFVRHQVFIELEELDVDLEDPSREIEWKETARWIKFEEDVNIIKGGFNKPHVPTLSFHSLSDLRKGIQTGCVILDLEADTLKQVACRVVNQLVTEKKLDPKHSEDVLKALLLRHHHEHSHTLWEDIRKTVLPHIHHHHRHKSHLHPQTSVDSPDIPSLVKQDSIVSVASAVFSPMDFVAEELGKTLNEEDDISHRSLILDKLPENTEATAVLVGPLQSLDHSILVFVRLKKACYLGNLLEVHLPVRFLFLLLGPVNSTLNYHEIGRAISTLMSNETFHDAVYQFQSQNDFTIALDNFLDESVVVLPGQWAPALEKPEISIIDDCELEGMMEFVNPQKLLRSTLRPFGGLYRDIKSIFNPRRIWSDIRDGINIHCFFVTFFVFFACLGPTLIFGGLYGEKTKQMIGEIETLMGSFVFGVIFSIFGGQPLMFIGASGPLLIFDQIIFQISEEIVHIDFLKFRAWIGIWLGLFLLIVVAFDLSFLVRYFTRFSEEIIASVTVCIFFIETIMYIVHVTMCYPIVNYSRECKVRNFTNTCPHTNNTNLTEQSQHLAYCHDIGPLGENCCECIDFCDDKIYRYSNTALFSVLIILSTFTLLLAFRRFRHSKFLKKRIRHLFSDFGIFIVFAIFTILAFFLREHIFLETVRISGKFLNPSSNRNWFIAFYTVDEDTRQLLSYFLAAFPAFLVCIIVVMETQLTNLFIAKKHHRLKKPMGFHLDLLLISIFAVISGVLGLPWFSGVAIRSIQHTQALAIYDTKTPPGERVKILGIREQRLTNLAIHLLIGMFIPLLWVVKTKLDYSLPVPVLFGGLVYLGYISWKGLQFVVRLRLLFMHSKHHPDTCYVNYVKTWKMHLFTIIQIVSLSILLAAKIFIYTAILFPILCVLLVPFTKLLSNTFTKNEISNLDHEEDNPKDLAERDDDTLSEYEVSHLPL